MTAHRLSWVGAIAVASGALLYGAMDEPPPRTDADRVYALAEDFGCPVCDGQSLADSDAPVARNLRREIGVWIDEGRSDDYIRDELVRIYGEDIDYTPAASGVTSLVWILPVVAVAAAATGLVVVFRGWRIRSDAGAAPEDVELVESTRSESES